MGCVWLLSIRTQTTDSRNTVLTAATRETAAVLGVVALAGWTCNTRYASKWCILAVANTVLARSAVCTVFARCAIDASGVICIVKCPRQAWATRAASPSFAYWTAITASLARIGACTIVALETNTTNAPRCEIAWRTDSIGPVWYFLKACITWCRSSCSQWHTIPNFTATRQSVVFKSLALTVSEASDSARVRIAQEILRSSWHRVV
jgi:hypothetical protein